MFQVQEWLANRWVRVRGGLTFEQADALAVRLGRGVRIRPYGY
jgi:hypothetical protein